MLCYDMICFNRQLTTNKTIIWIYEFIYINMCKCGPNWVDRAGVQQLNTHTCKYTQLSYDIHLLSIYKYIYSLNSIISTIMQPSPSSSLLFL